MKNNQTRTECTACEESVDKLVRHHTSYIEDVTVPVCTACHQRIHADNSHPLYPEGTPEETSIRVSDELADELFGRKKRGESYEDVIWRLIERADQYNEDSIHDDTD